MEVHASQSTQQHKLDWTGLSKEREDTMLGEWGKRRDLGGAGVQGGGEQVQSTLCKILKELIQRDSY